MSSIDYRHARQDQGFVYGRLIALIEHLDELVAGEPASAPQQKLTLLALTAALMVSYSSAKAEALQVPAPRGSMRRAPTRGGYRRAR